MVGISSGCFISDEEETLCWRSLVPAMQLSVCVCGDSIDRGKYRSCFRVVSRPPSWAKELTLTGLRQTQLCEYVTFVPTTPLYIISIIVTPVCSWIFSPGLAFWASFVQTCLHAQQLEGKLVTTSLETEVIVWLFLGVCIMLVCDLLLDQSLIKAGEVY